MVISKPIYFPFRKELHSRDKFLATIFLEKYFILFRRGWNSGGFEWNDRFNFINHLGRCRFYL
ncbi:hypothetical protein AC812_00200 [Bellilinea caldifistulae]|uniref:Uncharacterized protein n=1 Tax=Bellilinea caldifistulae TaxID=360411 RepID=A0A0P6XR24_9CHLR|nr:hypothetical protein AC812_00200 [Bellilinea caldifistulae]